MPQTYVPLGSYTTTAGQTSVTFSSIPSGYTDLVLSGQAGIAVGAPDDILSIRLNGATTGYSTTIIKGSGSAAETYRVTGAGYLSMGREAYNCAVIIHFLNYSNTTTNKSLIGRLNVADYTSGVTATVGLWQSTAAINSITIYEQAGAQFATGRVFSLYGIKAA